MKAEQLDLFKHGVAPTSREAFKTINENGKRITLRARVYEAIKVNPLISRMELSLLYNIRLSSVCGRVNELIGDGLISEQGSKRDPQTGMTVALLRSTCQQ